MIHISNESLKQMLYRMCLLSICLILITNTLWSQPTNNHVCSAIALSPDSSCHSGTTTNASNYFEPDYDCPEEYGPTVWYKTELTDAHNALDIQALYEGSTELIAITLMKFPHGCDSTEVIVPGSADCGSYPLSYRANDLDTGATYYIAVSSRLFAYTDFRICIDQADGCAVNYSCESARELSPLEVDSAFYCTTGCTVGARSPSSVFEYCSDLSEMSAVWYTFSRNTNADNININVSSEEIDSTIIIALIRKDCDEMYYYIQACVRGDNGYANLYHRGMYLDEYAIVVGTLPGDEGQFDLCVNVMEFEFTCMMEDDLRVINTSQGSPAGGPYQPGEKVTFEYTIDSFFGGACQWMQGIIPVFGNGWAPSSFTPEGAPVESDGISAVYRGEWNWYEEGTTIFQYSYPNYGLTLDSVYDRIIICDSSREDCDLEIYFGDDLPAGWLAYSNPEASDCPDTGSPYDGWGDGQGCGPMGGWSLSFTLTVRDSTGPESCASNGWVNCDVTLYPFTDNEIGCRYLDHKFCSMKSPERWTATNSCCDFPSASFEESNRDSSSVWLVNASQLEDSIRWYIGQDSSVTSDSIKLTWEQDGTVAVTLIAYNSCTNDTLNRLVTLSNAPPRADFEAGYKKVCTSNGEVPFFNASSSNITQWDWYFEGGNPKYSTKKNPVVNYSNPGRYDVRLIVRNAIGSDTMLWKDSIIVRETPIPAFDTQIDSLTVTLTLLPFTFTDSVIFEIEEVGTQSDSVSVFQLPGEGEYTVRIEVFNGFCMNSFERIIQVDVTDIKYPPGKEKLTVYPNPTRSNLYIRGGSAGAKALIFNHLGKKVDEIELRHSTTRYQAQQLKPGIYWIRTKAKVAKFIKQ